LSPPRAPQEVLTDIATLRKGECVKLTRKNDNMRPFEAGGEVSLEFLARKADCGLFALGSHSKKRRVAGVVVFSLAAILSGPCMQKQQLCM
jgi:hypothetical protein